jgi:putative ABC transport system permease protein
LSAASFSHGIRPSEDTYVSVAPLEEQLGTYLAQRRFQTSLLTEFSVVALLMAAIGIYGLIRYSTATRTQEIGLRMAIGA